jgi:class 3 adenylate cyclase
VEKVKLVVLFCDISGFMRLAVTLGDRMPVFIQAFYETIGEAVVGLGGTLVKYIGDSVLCVFPEAREADAVRCALRMRGDFGELLGRYASGGSARLEVAISSGEVVQGVYGHASLRTFDIMGEAVSHAAVMSRGPGIKITTQVRDAVRGQYRTKELPAIPLKWGGDPLEAWLVLED